MSITVCLFFVFLLAIALHFLFRFTASCCTIDIFNPSLVPQYDRGRDCMVVGFTTIVGLTTTHLIKFMSSNPAHGDVDSIQHNVIKFVSDLRQIGGFLGILQFPPPIKLIATI